MRLKYSEMCDAGLEYAVNQDSVLSIAPFGEDAALFVVADGMGGYSHGEKASYSIKKGLLDWAAHNFRCGCPPPPKTMLPLLEEVMQKINYAIYAELNQNGICGSTFVLLYICRGRYGVLWTGDSRLYHSQKGLCAPITQDDIWENQFYVQQRFSPTEQKLHPDYGTLVHAVGIQPNLICNSIDGVYKPGDLFALCSDGVYKMCPDSFLLRQLSIARWLGLEGVKRRIQREIIRAGAKDNYSLILVRPGILDT